MESRHFSVVCLTTCQRPLTKLVLHTGHPNASSFNLQCSLLSIRLSRSWLRLLPRLPFTSNLTSIFPSTTCFRRQFLRNTWPVFLAFLLCVFYTRYSSPSCLFVTLNFSQDRSTCSSPSLKWIILKMRISFLLNLSVNKIITRQERTNYSRLFTRANEFRMVEPNICSCFTYLQIWISANL
jgi:hypothetical protein